MPTRSLEDYRYRVKDGTALRLLGVVEEARLKNTRMWCSNNHVTVLTKWHLAACQHDMLEYRVKVKTASNLQWQKQSQHQQPSPTFAYFV